MPPEVPGVKQRLTRPSARPWDLKQDHDGPRAVVRAQEGDLDPVHHGGLVKGEGPHKLWAQPHVVQEQRGRDGGAVDGATGEALVEASGVVTGEGGGGGGGVCEEGECVGGSGWLEVCVWGGREAACGSKVAAAVQTVQCS